MIGQFLAQFGPRFVQELVQTLVGVLDGDEIHIGRHEEVRLEVFQGQIAENIVRIGQRHCGLFQNDVKGHVPQSVLCVCPLILQEDVNVLGASHVEGGRNGTSPPRGLHAQHVEFGHVQVRRQDDRVGGGSVLLFVGGLLLLFFLLLLL